MIAIVNVSENVNVNVNENRNVNVVANEDDGGSDDSLDQLGERGVTLLAEDDNEIGGVINTQDTMNRPEGQPKEYLD